MSQPRSLPIHAAISIVDICELLTVLGDAGNCNSDSAPYAGDVSTWLRVSPANVHDTWGAIDALSRADRFLDRPAIKKVYADKGYRGERFERFVAEEFDGARVQIGNNKTNAVDGFVPDKKRWVIERTFAWLLDCRRLIVDHERLLKHSVGMIRLSAIRLMLRRLGPRPNPTGPPHINIRITHENERRRSPQRHFLRSSSSTGDARSAYRDANLTFQTVSKATARSAGCSLVFEEKSCLDM